MSMIKSFECGVTTKEGGAIFSKTRKLTVELDCNPLTQSQFDSVLAEMNRTESALIADQRQGEMGRKPTDQPPVAPSAPKDPPAQANIDGSKPAAPPAKEVLCIVCGTPVELKVSPKNVEYSFCPHCKDNRRKDGTKFPPKEVK